ncbi:indole-3-acetic acid-amido synthetase GH3.10-like [Argentina anserina]|uniref:indole-3-acetic acid-amido synthetase GH3.10-like n=1 Tax=Argentina anserina TaxID=57926 RepID=UPI0021762B42|nr:indole-3-acetic acid-amido synthetase GH3.10-like [Potentilla anserina]
MEPDVVCNNHSNGHDIIRWFEDVSENAESVQTQTLRRIVELHWGVEYLRKWLGDVDIHKVDACVLESLYTSLVPLVSHADLEPYILRIANGYSSPILTQQPLTTLSLRVYPTSEGGKILEFLYSSKQFKTRGGLTAGTATTHYYYASQEFKIKQENTKSFTCSPKEVISSGDSYSIVQSFIASEGLWSDLCIDLRDGTLSKRINLPKVRKAVLDIGCVLVQLSLLKKLAYADF